MGVRSLCPGLCWRRAWKGRGSAAWGCGHRHCFCFLVCVSGKRLNVPGRPLLACVACVTPKHGVAECRARGIPKYSCREGEERRQWEQGGGRRAGSQAALGRGQPASVRGRWPGSGGPACARLGARAGLGAGGPLPQPCPRTADSTELFPSQGPYLQAPSLPVAHTCPHGLHRYAKTSHRSYNVFFYDLGVLPPCLHMERPWVSPLLHEWMETQ